MAPYTERPKPKLNSTLKPAGEHLLQKWLTLTPNEKNGVFASLIGLLSKDESSFSTTILQKIDTYQNEEVKRTNSTYYKP